MKFKNMKPEGAQRHPKIYIKKTYVTLVNKINLRLWGVAGAQTMAC